MCRELTYITPPKWDRLGRRRYRPAVDGRPLRRLAGWSMC